MRKLALTCAVLGIVSLCFFVLTNLALADIFRGEPDVVAEWRAVKLGIFPVLAFHLAAVAAFFWIAASSMKNTP